MLLQYEKHSLGYNELMKMVQHATACCTLQVNRGYSFLISSSYCLVIFHITFSVQKGEIPARKCPHFILVTFIKAIFGWARVLLSNHNVVIIAVRCSKATISTRNDISALCPRRPGRDVATGCISKGWRVICRPHASPQVAQVVVVVVSDPPGEMVT